MNAYDLRELFDVLSRARIYAGAELERLCNNNEHIDACVFQAVRDSIAQNIQLLQSYVICKAESEKKDVIRRKRKNDKVRYSKYRKPSTPCV